MHYYLDAWKHYVDFSGRANRAEFWWFVLFNVLAAIVCGIFDAVLGTTLFLPLYNLAVLLPSLALNVRRLHDLDHSGWFLLLGLIPIIGPLLLLVFFLLPGTAGQNRFD